MKARLFTVSLCLRVMTLMLILIGAASITAKPAAAAVTTVPLGCRASTTGGDIVIPLSNNVSEGAAIVVAVQVVARNEDLTGIMDTAGNSYTRLLNHLGIPIGPSGVQENDTLHVYAAFDAKALNSGQTITVRWNFSNGLEACAMAITGVTRTPLDKSAANHTSSTAMDSLNAASTTSPNELLVGAFGWFCSLNGALCNADATPGAGYAEVIEGQDVMLQARSVTAVGSYNAPATLNQKSDWNAALITLKVDTTPPVVTPSVTGTLGQNGWYTSDVVVWTVTDPESRVTSPPCTKTINTDTAGVTIPCTATSAGGSSTPQSITVKRDATLPTISAAVAPAPNASGWHNGDVTVSYTCADALSGLASACPAAQTISAEGNVVMPTISDLAGNKSVAGISARIDKSAPVVAVTGVNNGATYVVGAVPAATCSTTDALSGVATGATVAVTGGGPDGSGVFTVTCSGATDHAGNSSQPVAISYTVTAPPTPTPVPPTPTPSPTPTNVRTVAAWGYNGTGASSVPTGMQAIAVAGGPYHNLALKVDGTVAAWGCTGTLFGHCNVPAGLSGVKAIGAGTGHSLAVKADGTVVAWGCSSFGYGQCTPPVGLTGVISVAGGYVHSLALKSDGTVVAWGCAAGSWSAYGQCQVPKGLSGVKAIAAGYQHNLALKSDGTVVAWGRNTAGQINVPPGLNDVIAIAAGETHSLALKSNGTVVAWGSTTYGATTIPAGLTNVVAIGAGYYHSLALKRDGTLAAWGCVGGTNYNFGQCTIPAGLSSVTSISAGGAHNLVLTIIAPSGGGAGGAVVAADTSATPLTDTIPLTLPMLGEAFLPITPSLPVSVPVAVEVAPVVTDSAPVSVPAVVDTPAVTTTQPVTTGDAGVAPVDANAPAAPDASQQNQRLFLPIITNLASLAGAALGSAGGLALLAVVAVVLVVGLLRRRRTRR